MPPTSMTAMVCGIQYNGTPYFFLKNLQSDIIAITDSNANMVARYRYDAWGVCTIVNDTSGCSIATVNPFRYRGYYYDSETQLYYLQSRYYNPTVGRFINADDTAFVVVTRHINGFNLLIYCENNPVISSDGSGCISLRGLGDVFSSILSLGEDICEFLLGAFGISSNRYKKRNKYKKKKDLYNFVYENKSKIKRINSSISSISSFLEIVLTVADCAEVIRHARTEALAIAEILFDGLIRFIGFVAGKLFSWILSKICAALFWLRFVLNWILEYIFDKILSSSFASTIKENYLRYIEPSQVSFKGMIVALFKGVQASI